MPPLNDTQALQRTTARRATSPTSTLSFWTYEPRVDESSDKNLALASGYESDLSPQEAILALGIITTTALCKFTPFCNILLHGSGVPFLDREVRLVGFINVGEIRGFC